MGRSSRHDIIWSQKQKGVNFSCNCMVGYCFCIRQTGHITQKGKSHKIQLRIKAVWVPHLQVVLIHTFNIASRKKATIPSFSKSFAKFSPQPENATLLVKPSQWFNITLDPPVSFQRFFHSFISGFIPERGSTGRLTAERLRVCPELKKGHKEVWILSLLLRNLEDDHDLCWGSICSFPSLSCILFFSQILE